MLNEDGVIELIPPYFRKLCIFFKQEMGIMVQPNGLYHQITSQLESYYKNYVSGKRETASAQVVSLVRLAEELNTIKTLAGEHEYQKFLKKISDSNNYHGFRFESFIYSKLLKSEIAFKYQDRPDFLITKNDVAAIECKVLLSDNEITDKERLVLRINTMIFGSPNKNKDKDAKNLKPYAARSCGLFVDWTQLYQYAVSLSIQCADTEQYLDEAIQDIVEKMKFGALVLFNHTYEKSTESSVIRHRRYDSKDISPELEETLNIITPKGDEKVYFKDNLFPNYS